MTTATLHALPLDDDETAVLTEIVEWRLSEELEVIGVDESSRPQRLQSWTGY